MVSARAAVAEALEGRWVGVPLWGADDILAAIAAAGFAVVPEEPTETMIAALQSYATCSGHVEEGYRAMIASAQGPKP